MIREGGGRDRDWLLARLPQKGAMNLLERIERWSDEEIACTARSHVAPGHPLRCGDLLPSCAAIEYAAQAVAAHGALLAGDDGTAGAGFLASARAVDLHVARLDDLAGPLAIHARRLSADASGLLYEFRVACGSARVASGRLAIALAAAGASA